MNRRMLIALVVLTAVAATGSAVWADKPTQFDSKGNEVAWNHTGCTTIQLGSLYASDGSLLTTGYDQWGYNYQGHIFNGKYRDAYRDAAWCQAYAEVDLMMKWNDAWLANVDCTGDGLLDRHYGLPSYIGSGARETDHQSGAYDLDGKTCTWEYFVKIVAAPEDAVLAGGVWYTADGTEIGILPQESVPVGNV